MTAFSADYSYAAGAFGAQVFGNAVPLLEIQTGPTDFANVLEIGYTIVLNAINSVQLSLGVGRPAARGVGINPSSFLRDDSGNTGSLSGVQLFTLWSTTPTAPSNFFRRLTTGCGNSSSPGGGQPIIFRFPKGIKMQPSASVVLWNITSGVNLNNGLIFDPWVVIDS